MKGSDLILPVAILGAAVLLLPKLLNRGQEETDMSVPDWLHAQADIIREERGIVLNVEERLMGGDMGCLGGRRLATDVEYNQLLKGPVMGCGRSVNPLTGEGYFYCDC